MKQILLMMIGLSTLIYADFNRNTEGVVTDSKTNLQWQDNYSDNANAVKSAAWAAAISYCESLDLDGGKWRLPNLNELTSLLDDTRGDPSINNVFQNTTSDNYWSSTTQVSNTDKAYFVGFYFGYQYMHSKTTAHLVRCVRSGQQQLSILSLLQIRISSPAKLKYFPGSQVALGNPYLQVSR